MTPEGTVLIYRDSLLPRSEFAFLRRQYIGFRRLEPLWLTRRPSPQAAALPGRVVRLGGEGVAGAVRRWAFRLGQDPSAADIAALRAERPRVVHAQFARGGAMALPIARALGLPLAVTVHGGDVTKRRNWERGVLARRWEELRSEAALFLCVSPHLAAVLAGRGVPASRILVHPIGVERGAEAAEAEAGPRRGHLFVGRFVEKKGIATLVEAVRLLRAAGSTEPVACIGDGPLRPVLAAAGVELPGWLPVEAVRARMRRARSLWVPSTTARSGDEEGLPTVAVEAMAEGCPVLGSAIPGLVYALRREGAAGGPAEAGVLVAPGDAAGLAMAARRLELDAAFGMGLGAAGRRIAAERFDAHRQSAALEARLLELAAAWAA